MSFVEVFNSLPGGMSPLLRRFEAMLAPTTREQLAAMAAKASAVTRRQFGRTMRMFAPLYLSNECINNCKYCGFSRDNPILRVTLDVGQVIAEAHHLRKQGFRSILLVAGEHPKFVSNGYLAECVREVAKLVPSVSVEVGPMEEPEYRQVVAAGAEGLVVYQETYHRPTYTEMHTAGPKRNFDWRLETPERGHAAGFRRIGVGCLFGLHDWREEALALAAHVEFLLKTCWRSQITVSLPRLRPAAGGFQPRFQLPDRDYIQLVCALRLAFPTVGIVLSTRESPALRDAVMPIGITMMSAGSQTDPGGYTGQGRDDLHLTVRGRRVAPENSCQGESATGQFEIADHRPPAEIADALRRCGLDPVWKDWDATILAPQSSPSLAA